MPSPDALSAPRTARLPPSRPCRSRSPPAPRCPARVGARSTAVAVDDELVWVTAVPAARARRGASAVPRRLRPPLRAARGGPRGGRRRRARGGVLGGRPGRRRRTRGRRLPRRPPGPAPRRRAVRRRRGHRLARSHGPPQQHRQADSPARADFLLKEPRRPADPVKQGLFPRRARVHPPPAFLEQETATAGDRRPRDTPSHGSASAPRARPRDRSSSRWPRCSSPSGSRRARAARRPTGSARRPCACTRSRRPDDGRLVVAGPSARGAGAPVTLDAGMEFSMAGVTCDVPAAGAVTLRLRTSLDGAAWGPWLEAPLELAGEGAAATAFTDAALDRPRPLRAGRGGDGRPGAGPAALTGVRLVAIDPTEDGRHRRARHRRRPAARRHRGRRQPRRAGLRGRRRPDHRHPLGVGRRRVAAQRGAVLRPGQDGVRAPHRERQPLLARRRSRARARHLRLPHQDPALERHRLQLPRRPLRHHLRGALRRRRPRRRRRARVRLQHRQHRHLRHGHLHRRGAAGRGGDGARAAAGLEARPSTGSTRRARPSSPAAPRTSTRRAPRSTFPVIAGHRQANYTECPGAALYALLPSVRADVAEARRAPPSSPRSARARRSSAPTATACSTPPCSTSASAPPPTGGVAVRDAGGQTVASWSGQGTSAAVTWNGTSGGARVAGRRLHRRAHGHAGRRRAGRGERADHRRHGRAAAQRTPRPRARSAPTATARPSPPRSPTRPAEACAVRVGILDARRRRGPLAPRLAGARGPLVLGHVGRPHHLRRRPRGRAPTGSTASPSSAATPPATSPGRASGSPSIAPSASRPPSPSPSPPTGTASATRRRSASS